MVVPCRFCDKSSVDGVCVRCRDELQAKREQEKSRKLCATHPDVDYRLAWGCPECLRKMRELLRFIHHDTRGLGLRSMIEEVIGKPEEWK